MLTTELEKSCFTDFETNKPIDALAVQSCVKQRLCCEHVALGRREGRE